MRTSKNILSDKEQELVSLLMQDCQSTGDIQSRLKRLFAGTIEQMLEAEMDEHLGYDKNSVEGNNSGNSRNGYNRKTIISDYGESEVAVPRDRNGEFVPKVLEKRQTRLAFEFEHQVQSGDVIASGTTFESFSDKWLETYAEKHLGKVTVEHYRRLLRLYINPAIGKIKLRDLKPLHLVRLYDNLTEDGVKVNGDEGGYSTGSIAFVHRVVSTVLQTAVQWRLVGENVAKSVKPPKGGEGRSKDNFLTAEQTQALLRYIAETQSLSFQALVLVTIYGGLRRGEVMGLTWRDVDFSSNTISINKSRVPLKGGDIIKETKTKSSVRKVVMPEAVISVLEELKRTSTSTIIFPQTAAAATSWFRRLIRRYNERHEDKLPEGITFHGLRHTSATLLIAQGMDVKTVSARLGHTNTSTTLNVYAHAIESRDQIAADALANALTPKKQETEVKQIITHVN